VLQSIGFSQPTNPQSKECAAVLREFLGESKKIQGQYKWRIPFKKDKKWMPLPSTKFISEDDY
jgi:putative DNA primase/helicase